MNTAHEFDGSDSGARPDEAISWGKIKVGTNPVKVSLATARFVSLWVRKHVHDIGWHLIKGL